MASTRGSGRPRVYHQPPDVPSQAVATNTRFREGETARHSSRLVPVGEEADSTTLYTRQGFMLVRLAQLRSDNVQPLPKGLLPLVEESKSTVRRRKHRRHVGAHYEEEEEEEGDSSGSTGSMETPQQQPQFEGGAVVQKTTLITRGPAPVAPPNVSPMTESGGMSSSMDADSGVDNVGRGGRQKPPAVITPAPMDLDWVNVKNLVPTAGSKRYLAALSTAKPMQPVNECMHYANGWCKWEHKCRFIHVQRSDQRQRRHQVGVTMDVFTSTPDSDDDDNKRKTKKTKGSSSGDSQPSPDPARPNEDLSWPTSPTSQKGAEQQQKQQTRPIKNPIVVSSGDIYVTRGSEFYFNVMAREGKKPEMPMKLCKHFSSKGFCLFGATCRFIHRAKSKTPSVSSGSKDHASDSSTDDG